MYDLIIVGAGPAGLSCGIYAGRFRLNTLILEKAGLGGQIVLSPKIENFPGFPDGIYTQELMERFKKQVDDLEVRTETGEACQILPDLESKIPAYNIKTENKTYQARAIVIASGAQSKKLDVKGEKELIGRGVSYCGTCDGPLFKNKDIVVVGGGDRAIEEAIFLSEYANTVKVIHRRAGLRASKILEDKAKQNPKISFILDSVVEEIIGQNKVQEVRIKNVQTGSASALSCQGVFIFVGIKPNTDFLKNILNMDEFGFIITEQDLKTSRQGIFACGDCRKKSLYQVINACGEGAVAADSAYKYLLGQ